jgi:hypothetical protein
MSAHLHSVANQNDCTLVARNCALDEDETFFDIH